MEPLEETSKILILGAGSGGTAILTMLLDEELVEVIGIVDHNAKAPGLMLAKKEHIPIYDDVEVALKVCAPCVAFNLTKNEMVEHVAADLLGAGSVIGGLEARLLWRMFTRLQKAKQEMQFQATHDPLTGIYNRRFLMKKIKAGLEEAARYHFPYSIALLDLDHFKQVNDTHGHDAGDTVLTETTKLLASCVRKVDSLGRWGGEEFLVLLPHTTGEEAVHAAGSWLNKLAALPMDMGEGIKEYVTFSAGVACCETTPSQGTQNKTIKTLIALADERLYAAKEAGRKRVEGSCGCCATLDLQKENHI